MHQEPNLSRGGKVPVHPDPNLIQKDVQGKAPPVLLRTQCFCHHLVIGRVIYLHLSTLMLEG